MNVYLIPPFQTLCCLSVVKDFHTLCKYNIHSLVMPTQDHTHSKGSKTDVQTSPCIKEKASCEDTELTQAAETGENVMGASVEESSACAPEKGVGSGVGLEVEPDTEQT